MSSLSFEAASASLVSEDERSFRTLEFTFFPFVFESIPTYSLAECMSVLLWEPWDLSREEHNQKALTVHHYYGMEASSEFDREIQVNICGDERCT